MFGNIKTDLVFIPSSIYQNKMYSKALTFLFFHNRSARRHAVRGKMYIAHVETRSHLMMRVITRKISFRLSFP